MTHVFGPVPSRRLGFSLGIDPVPFKTCTLDCVYCQLGRTTLRTSGRKVYVPPVRILKELKDALGKKSGRIDYITFSGSGEPTLNSAIGRMIAGVKKITDIPVAVLTNGTLLSRKDVRDDLLEADVVIPSLDAASPEVFKKINRPHQSLKPGKIIQGIAEFRKKFKGKIWLEVMLVKGINDGREAIKDIKKAIDIIKPDRVDLNTVVRPPAEKFARALSTNELEKIRKYIGGNCNIIIEKLKSKESRHYSSISAAAGDIVLLAGRRPVTVRDISASLGLSIEGVEAYLKILEDNGRIKCRVYRKKRYYCVL